MTTSLSAKEGNRRRKRRVAKPEQRYSSEPGICTACGKVKADAPGSGLMRVEIPQAQA